MVQIIVLLTLKAFFMAKVPYLIKDEQTLT